MITQLLIHALFFLTKKKTIQFDKTEKEAKMETLKQRKLEIFCTGTVTIFGNRSVELGN